MVLVDATEPNKSVKVIKDHHKNVPIANIKFCDWQGSYFKIMDEKNQDHAIEDKKSWMFISID